MSADAALCRDLATLAECMRLVAGGIDRLVARHGQQTVPPGFEPQPAAMTHAVETLFGGTVVAGLGTLRWPEERVDLIGRLLRATPLDKPIDWTGITDALNALPGPKLTSKRVQGWYIRRGKKRLGLSTHPVDGRGASAGQRWGDELVDQVLRRRAEGLKQTEIAEALGIPVKKVQNIIFRRGRSAPMPAEAADAAPPAAALPPEPAAAEAAEAPRPPVPRIAPRAVAAAADAPPTMAPSRNGRSYPQDLVDEVLRRHAAGEERRNIAQALGVERQKVSNIITWRGPTAAQHRQNKVDRRAAWKQQPAKPAQPPPTAPPLPAPRPQPIERQAPAGIRRVELPSADAEMRRHIAESLVAPADELTIRSWAIANGVAIPGDGELGAASLMRVNAVREREQLPPFKLVRKPMGVVPADELERMRNDAAVPVQPGVQAAGHSGGSYGAPAPR